VRELAHSSRSPAAADAMRITLLDYGAGNVCSLRNALDRLGCEILDVRSPKDIADAEVLIFPGVGSFGNCMSVLAAKGYIEPLREYLRSDRPFLGICLGMQSLFEESEESPGVRGLGIIPGCVERFRVTDRAVPQIGWNSVTSLQPRSPLLAGVQPDEAVYFVHSYRVAPSAALAAWTLCETSYGERFVSGVSRGSVSAVQFHPEKSGVVGLRILGAFLSAAAPASPLSVLLRGARLLLGGLASLGAPASPSGGYCRRIVACLDVRANDAGDLVVTKGDQYDVREKGEGGDVRNLGKPVALARRYYEEGADEITFLNITGFRECPLHDLPMLKVLSEASRHIFVPLTVGGGIRDMVDKSGAKSSAVEVAAAYFRAGADKVSIGTDAVDAARGWIERRGGDGSTSIEQISHIYGRQAVVVSIDPRRVWVASEAEAAPHPTTSQIAGGAVGPKGERLCWYECTVQGGRKGSGLDVVQVTQAVEALGAGEILLNCIDCDGQHAGFEMGLLNMVKGAVAIPVIASSGAGSAAHFVDVFAQTSVEAALAASIFHHKKVSIDEVKDSVAGSGKAVRRTARAAQRPPLAGLVLAACVVALAAIAVRKGK